MDFQRAYAFYLFALIFIPALSNIRLSSLSNNVKSLHDLERQWQHKLRKKLKTENIKIRGFFHGATMYEHWPSVLKDLFYSMNGQHRAADCDIRNCPNYFTKERRNYMQGYGLLSLLDKMELHVSDLVRGPRAHPNLSVSGVIDSMKLELRQKVEVTYHKGLPRKMYRNAISKWNLSRAIAFIKPLLEAEELSSGEYPTLTALQDFCRSEVALGRNSFVVYSHLKSGRATFDQFKGTENTSYWREFMSTVILEYPSICIRALLEGSSVCGILFKELPSPHFHGNFWWASCNHIASLPHLYSPLLGYLDAEMWLMRVGQGTADFSNNCAYVAVRDENKGRMRYFHSDMPEDYLPLIKSYLQDASLPRCGRTLGSKSSASDDTCGGGGIKKTQELLRRRCLSALTPSPIRGKNPYNISADLQTAWEHTGNAKFIQLCMETGCASNFSRDIRSYFIA
jgi:hypothetical protein